MIIKINFIRRKSNETNLVGFDEFEAALIKKERCKIKVIKTEESKLKNIILKFLDYMDFMKYIKSKNNTISLSILMGPYFGCLIPHIFSFDKNFIYMFDAWPRYHKYIIKTANILNVKVIFFSSYQVTNLFNELNSGIKGIWIPEGINTEKYHYEPYSLKKIDVLEFGRKYDLYNEKITLTLKDNNYSHLFEKIKGEVVFKSKLEFFKGLAQSKISICVPSDLTHPERAEGISTMTLRYLQSMCSKCLIVGVLPEEMKMLFDYMPIIEIDMENASSQILEILSNYESYIPLIERNYKEVNDLHSWDIRIENILTNIKK
jgi:hypothetical protein